MLSGIAVGAVCGILWPSVARVAGPVGDAFLNLIFVLVVPLVFFSVSLSLCRLRSGGKLGTVVGRMVVVFVLMWLLYCLITYPSTLIFSLTGDGPTLLPSASGEAGEAVRLGGNFAAAVSVDNFPNLFSKYNLLPLIIFSALLGLGVSMAGEKGASFRAFLESGEEVISQTLNLVMYAAPVGLGCYMADTLAGEGLGMAGGYMRVLLLYCALTLFFFFIVNPLLVRVTHGRAALKAFWQNILPPSLTAVATASSAAAMPGNIEAARRMGVDRDVADTVVPLATNLLKAGSVCGGVLKAVFAMMLGGMDYAGLGPGLTCIGIAILAGAVTGAVVNGGVTGGVLVCSMLGLADPAIVGAVTIVGTLFDIPATLLNSQANVVAAVLVDRRRAD